MSSLFSRRTLVVAVMLFIALAGVESARILLFARPTAYATGFYAWEAAPGRDGASTSEPFRWMGKEARLLDVVEGPVLTVPLYQGRPDIAPDGLSLELSIGQQPLDSLVLRDGGWYELEYYLPPILGEDAWMELAGRETSAQGASRTAESPGGAESLRFTGWQELQPWKDDPVPTLWLGLAVGTTFVPSEHSDSGDHRDLGIGLGELQWGRALAEAGIGFHAWEQTPEGQPFRWTRQRASQPLRTGGLSVTFRLRADHPDLQQRPVEVLVFWGARLLETVILVDSSWADVAVTTGAAIGVEGVLSLHVDRTWTPSSSGSSEDSRRLGVVVTPVEWR